MLVKYLQIKLFTEVNVFCEKPVAIQNTIISRYEFILETLIFYKRSGVIGKFLKD